MFLCTSSRLSSRRTEPSISGQGILTLYRYALTVYEDKPKENLELAFSVAERTMSIPRLLEPSDFEEGIDEPSLLTYLSLFVTYSPDAPKKVIVLFLA
jgi:hypothetical protein